MPVYENVEPAISGWQLTKARRSFSYPGCEGRSAKVEVYARAASVELFLNGKSLGKKKPKKARALFTLSYEPGELLAVSYDAKGKEIGRDCLKSAGEALELRLEPETAECRPGEMVYLRMRYTDETGELRPMEKHTLSVRAENGTVIGTANASACFRGNYAQTRVPTYFGEAQAIVQAGPGGTVRVAVSDGEREAVAEIVCRG